MATDHRASVLGHFGCDCCCSHRRARLTPDLPPRFTSTFLRNHDSTRARSAAVSNRRLIIRGPENVGHPSISLPSPLAMMTWVKTLTVLPWSFGIGMATKGSFLCMLL